MAAKWKVNNLKYYLSKDGKEKVVYNVDYQVSDFKTVNDNLYSGSYQDNLSFDLETVEAIKAKDAVLYTDKDTLLTDKAVKVGDIKTPAVEAVEGKNPWSSVDFVEYDKLTENMVADWIKSALGEDKIKEIEDIISGQIQMQENPPTATEGNGVPW